MIIPIDENWRIESDPKQWIIKQRVTHTNTKTGEPVDRWKNMLYYPSLEGALNGLFHVRLKLSKAEGLAECIAESKRLCKLLKNAVEPHIKLELTR